MRKEIFFFFSLETLSNRQAAAYLEAVVSPRAELHYACLFVERKIFDVDLAGRLINRRRLPFDSTRVIKSRLRRQRYLEVTVGAVQTRNRSFII